MMTSLTYNQCCIYLYDMSAVAMLPCVYAAAIIIVLLSQQEVCAVSEVTS